jgi:hypothetical protein
LLFFLFSVVVKAHSGRRNRRQANQPPRVNRNLKNFQIVFHALHFRLVMPLPLPAHTQESFFRFRGSHVSDTNTRIQATTLSFRQSLLKEHAIIFWGTA